MRHRHHSHLVRDVAIVVAAIGAVCIAGWIAEGFGFALILSMMLGTAVILAVPFITIYYEEKDLPRGRRFTGL